MINPSTGDRFIFVGGSPRSGTTLLQNMLDSHPDICGGPEFLHLPDIMKLRNRLHQSIGKNWIVEFCSYDDVDELTCSLIADLLLPLADKYGCKFLSEKTPANVLIFLELMKLFPQAYFIHVVRDPRAIIASMLQVGRRGEKQGNKTQDFTTNVLAAISYVKRCFRAGFVAADLAPGRVLTVGYEQLVTAPEGETKRICSFLGIEWSNQMMHPGSFKHLGEEAICNEVWYDKKTYNRDPDTRGIDKWKNQLTSLQKIMITVSFREVEYLSQFGYDFSTNGLSRTEYGLGLILSILNSWPDYRFRRAKKVLLKSIRAIVT